MREMMNVSGAYEKANKWILNHYLGIGIKLRHNWNHLSEDERGMGMVEIAIIIVILVALAATFHAKLTDILNNLMKIDQGGLKFD